MMNQTFSIPRNITQKLIEAAQQKIERYENFLPETEDEIAYLESEISAVSSFIDFHNLQAEREIVVCGLFRHEGEYGASLEFPSSTLDAASARLVELQSRLISYTNRRNSLNHKISFLKKDIDLLNSMLKSSPRARIIEFCVPAII